jgi:CDP-6-deoxy-D-xylo-4-hexulose-3-dehydrase
VEKRKANFVRLYEGLKDLSQLRLFENYEESDPSWFGFLMTVKPDAGFTRNELAKCLEAANIQTRNLFAGNIIRHPCFETMREGIDYRVAGSLATTDTIMNSSLWIGLYPGMGDAKIDYMIKTIRGCCGK